MGWGMAKKLTKHNYDACLQWYMLNTLERGYLRQNIEDFKSNSKSDDLWIIKSRFNEIISVYKNHDGINELYSSKVKKPSRFFFDESINAKLGELITYFNGFNPQNDFKPNATVNIEQLPKRFKNFIADSPNAIFNLITEGNNKKYIIEMFNYLFLIESVECNLTNILGLYRNLTLINSTNDALLFKRNASNGAKIANRNYNNTLWKRGDYLNIQLRSNDYIYKLRTEYFDAKDANNKETIKEAERNLINALVILDYEYCQQEGINAYKLSLEDFKNTYKGKKGILSLSRSYFGRILKKRVNRDFSRFEEYFDI